MDRRRRLVFGLLVAAPIAAIAAACTFPDVTFSTNSSSSGTSGTSGSTEAGSEVDGSEFKSDADKAPEFDGAIEAGVLPEGAAPVDASTCTTAAPCDCDYDGYRTLDCPADAGFDANTKPGDCDDLDPRRHPEQAPLDVVPDQNTNPPPAGDWDCNGTAVPIPPQELKCNAPSVFDIGLVKTITCNGGGKGFRTKPACGAKADYYECPTGNAGSVADCLPKASGTQATQLCQ